MMSFFKARGCVVTFPSREAGGIMLEGFPKGAEGAPILLTDTAITHKDLVLPVTTLSNKKVLYSFGSDFGTASISGIVFVGSAEAITTGLGDVKDWYDLNSVGNKKEAKTVALSLLDTAMSVYIVGLSFGQPNAELNYVPFTIAAIEAS